VKVCLIFVQIIDSRVDKGLGRGCGVYVIDCLAKRVVVFFDGFGYCSARVENVFFFVNSVFGFFVTYLTS
jgi:hypothetical protein